MFSFVLRGSLCVAPSYDHTKWTLRMEGINVGLLNNCANDDCRFAVLETAGWLGRSCRQRQAPGRWVILGTGIIM